MKFTTEEIEFVKRNKPFIQSILQKKLEDVLDDMIYDDEDKLGVLRLWAKELKELIITLDNVMKIKPKIEKKKDTGI